MITTTTSARAEFERRSARAEILAKNPSAAREPLLFAAVLSRAQGALAAELETAHEDAPLTGRLPDDVDRLVPLAESLLRIVEDRGPEQLAAAAVARLTDDAATARTRLGVYWTGDISALQDYLSRAILQPYAAVLRGLRISPERLHREGHCPFCGGPPIMSTRRTPADSEAAQRLLHCSLCGQEWNFNRVRCPSCGEEHPEKLPVYRSDAHPLVRIEACETCHRYTKSIDLTQDMRPIAEIDDLLSLSMDLWAMEQGLTRIEPGLAGV